MKKLFIIMTLFVSSFFLFSISKVSADTYTLEMSEETTNIINDEFFELREKALQYLEENSFNYYLIYYNSSDLTYRVAFSKTTTPSVSVSLNTSTNRLMVKLSNYKHYNLVNNEFQDLNILTSVNVSICSNVAFYYNLLDSNFDINYNLTHTYNFNYKDSTYTIENGSTIPTLYQIYLENNILVDPFEEEKAIIDNFYSIIFIKIGDLATNFVNSYIFLFVFGIFILIFVFELIRRWLL